VKNGQEEAVEFEQKETENCSDSLQIHALLALLLV
jgi:hypothetical protein